MKWPAQTPRETDLAEWVETACGPLCYDAERDIRRETEVHYAHAYEAALAKGLPESDAHKQALQELGDAKKVRLELCKRYLSDVEMTLCRFVRNPFVHPQFYLHTLNCWMWTAMFLLMSEKTILVLSGWLAFCVFSIVIARISIRLALHAWQIVVTLVGIVAAVMLLKSNEERLATALLAVFSVSVVWMFDLTAHRAAAKLQRGPDCYEELAR